MKLLSLRFANFSPERGENVSRTLGVLSLVEMIVAVVGATMFGYFFFAWVGASGLLMGGVAGGVRGMSRVLNFGRKIQIRKPGFLVRAVRVRTCGRAYRSASRPAFSHDSGGGDSGDDGGSDSGPSGDQPRFFPFAVNPFSGFFDISFRIVSSPWLCHGCWRMACRKDAVKGARS